ncbi:MAG: glycosyltransferase [Opitutales bacterium]
MNAIWACAQIGARDAYQIPRALAAENALAFFLTDFWNDYPRWSQPVLPSFFESARQRVHPDLDKTTVVHLGLGQVRFEQTARIRKWDTWKVAHQRSAYYQRNLLKQIAPLRADLKAKAPGIVFAYSYEAALLFEFFREVGWRCVLGQTDAGPAAERNVEAEALRDPAWPRDFLPAPELHWQLWRRELELADCIAVPSPWVGEQLEAQASVEPDRIVCLPPVFEGDRTPRDPLRAYPGKFTAERPLRILIPAPCTLRTGRRIILEAAQQLADAPVKWQITDVLDAAQTPEPFRALASVKWLGTLNAQERLQALRSADLLLHPALCGSGAEPQLEALAEGLPVLATDRGAAVVKHDTNALRLESPSVDAVVAALRTCLENPAALERWSRHCTVDAAFTLPALQRSLRAIEARLIGMERA